MTDEKAITATDEPGGGGDALEMRDGRDRALLRSVVKRWGITPERKARYLAKLDAAMEEAETPRDVASIVKTLVAMESQNQADEHMEAKVKAGLTDTPTITVKVIKGVDPEAL